MRLFIAVAIPDKIKGKIGNLISSLAKSGADIKWVKPENLHLTLKFLGEVKAAEPITEKLGPIGKVLAPFTISLRGLGNFDHRVFWIGVEEGQKELGALTGKIEQAMEDVGFKREERGFSAHLTIGRARTGKTKALFEAMGKEKETFFGRWQVNSFELVKSTLTPKGPLYETKEEFICQTIKEKH